MSTTFESLTEKAKENYHKFFEYYDKGKYAEALVSARIFVEFIAKAGIYEICHNKYDKSDILFQDLEKKEWILIQHNHKYYTVKPEDIENARKGENGNGKADGFILEGNNGSRTFQIGYNIIQDKKSYIFKFESSGLINVLGGFIEQFSPEAYFKFRNSSLNLDDLYKNANPGAHSIPDDLLKKAAYYVNNSLKTDTFKLFVFCKDNAKFLLRDTTGFLKELTSDTEKTISSSAKTPNNRPAQQNRSYNGYSNQTQNAAADINKYKEAELKRQQEEAERAKRQREAELKRQQEEAERAKRQREAELKRQQEEAERARKQVEAELKRQQEETERAERARKQVEAELKRQQEEAERAKRQREAELKRQQEEAERARRQVEAELKRQQEETERARRQREAELKRQQEEAERERRLKEEAERARRQIEAELKRQQEEAERAKRQREAELKRQQEEAERARRLKEAELKRQQEEAERAKRQKEAELKRQQEQKKEKEIELIKRIISYNDSIWRYKNDYSPRPSDVVISSFGRSAIVQALEKERLIASKELERLNPSFKIEYCNSIATGLICPNGLDLYEIKKYNTYSDFTEKRTSLLDILSPISAKRVTQEQKEKEERRVESFKENEILEKAIEIRNTFLGAVLNVAISIILILFLWDLIPTHSWIKYACLIATISIGAFVPFIIDLIFTAISNDSQFLTKPFISQAKESLKIRVRDDFKWTITEFGPSLVSVAIATLTLFLTDNAILSVLIGNFGIILTTQIICFKNFHDQKSTRRQYYHGPFYYPQSTHWVSIFTNAFISFSIPAVIYLLFFA